MTCVIVSFFFFNDTATTEIYTLSLHDALPISRGAERGLCPHGPRQGAAAAARHRPARAPQRAYPRRHGDRAAGGDRKSTRLNSSHANISYAVFCLKKKKTLCLLSPSLSSSAFA